MREELKAILTEGGVEFKGNISNQAMRELIVENLGVEALPVGETPEGHFAHVVTQEDLDVNPELVEQGVFIGETIFISEVGEDLEDDDGENILLIIGDDQSEPKNVPVATAPEAPAPKPLSVRKAGILRKLAPTVEEGGVLMLCNVKHNGVYYDKGSRYAPDAKTTAFFKENGWVE